MIEKTKISFSGLPGLYPAGYTGIIQLDDVRPVKIDTYTERHVTENKWQTKFNSRYENLKVQTSTYDRYQIVTIRKETQTFELLMEAESVTVLQTEEGISHTAQVLSVEAETISNSAFQKVIIEYYDSDITNYLHAEPVLNYLKSDTLLARYGAGSLNRLIFSGNNISITIYTIYGIVTGKLITKEPENVSTTEISGTNKDTRLTDKKAIDTLFYVGGDKVQTLRRYLLLSNNYSLFTSITDNLFLYPGKERPEFTLEEVPNAVDLWRLRISLVYTVTDNYIYA